MKKYQNTSVMQRQCPKASSCHAAGMKRMRSRHASRICEIVAMPRYRCFCLTDDDRIITGAFIEAATSSEAVAAADKRWRNDARYDHLEIWLGMKRLVPPCEIG